MTTFHPKPPTDAKRTDAAGRGWQKSQLAQARFCTAPVTLKPAPWEDEKEAEE